MNNKNRLFFLIAALFGTALIIIATSSYGIGVEVDSVPYIAAARNITRGNWFMIYNGEPLVLWPPFYPIILAFAGFVLNSDPLIIANLLNALIFGGTIYLTGLLAERYLSSRLLIILTVALVLFSVPLFQINLMALSEPLFIFLIVLALLYADSYFRKRDYNSLIIFSMAASLASVTRYAGVALIFTGVVLILLSSHTDLKQKLLHFIIFIVITSLPLGLWLVRNYFIVSSFVPVASPIFSLTENLNSTLNTIFNWYIPVRLKNSVFLLIAAIVFLFLYFLSRRIGLKRIKIVFDKAGVFVLFILIYSAFLIVTTSVVALDKTSDRFMVPVFIPLFLMIIIILKKLISFLREGTFYKAVNLFLIAILSLWILNSIKIIGLDYLPGLLEKGITKYQGAGCYNNKSWRESPMVNFLETNTAMFDGYSIYSNARDALYISTGLEGEWSPVKYKYNSADEVEEIEKGTWPYEEEAYLIWFYKINWPNRYTAEELQEIAGMKEVVRLNDGVVYFVTRAATE